MKRFIATLLTGIGLFFVQSGAFAVVASVDVSPSSVTVAASRSANVNLTWRVTTAFAVGALPALTTSQQLVVTNGGGDVSFGVISRPLSRTIAPGETAVISETVQIPRSIIEAMRRSNESSFRLRRSFSDPDLIVVGDSASLYLTGGSGSGLLQIDRMALTFDDASTLRVVSKDERFKALLDVQFSGSGMFRGVWEIATPASTPGEPIYTTLRPVHQVLAGNRTRHFESPELPSRAEGVYLLRFRVIEPEIGYEPVTVRYLVTSSGSPEKPPVTIETLSPADGSLINTDSRFAWSGGGEAQSWRLEIYAKPADRMIDQLPDLGGTPPTDSAPAVNGPLLTGMILPEQTRETALSKMVWQHLQPGQGYLWRIRSVDDEGNVIGESPLIEFRTP